MRKKRNWTHINLSPYWFITLQNLARKRKTGQSANRVFPRHHTRGAANLNSAFEQRARAWNTCSVKLASRDEYQIVTLTFLLHGVEEEKKTQHAARERRDRAAINARTRVARAHIFVCARIYTHVLWVESFCGFADKYFLFGAACAPERRCRWWKWAARAFSNLRVTKGGRDFLFDALMKIRLCIQGHVWRVNATYVYKIVSGIIYDRIVISIINQNRYSFRIFIESFRSLYFCTWNTEVLNKIT